MQSRVAYYEKEAAPRLRQVKFQNVIANQTFVLEANERLVGPIVIFNNHGTVTQAAITVGTAPAGTQVDAGATTAALTTAARAVTDIGITRADRTIYVQSAAWQSAAALVAGVPQAVHVVFNIEQYPPAAQIPGSVVVA